MKANKELSVKGQEVGMDELQNQDLVDDQVMEAINNEVASAELIAPPTPVVPAPNPVPAPTPAPVPAPVPAPSVTPAAASPIAAPVIATKVPSVHDLGLVEKTPTQSKDSADPKPAKSTVVKAPAASKPATTSSDDAPKTPEDQALVDVKKQALEQLSPLIGNLDLPSEEKFDTYMEVIRASDNKDLVQPAFEAAQSIEDEDKKAQALLEIVNEVNYLTQDKKED